MKRSDIYYIALSICGILLLCGCVIAGVIMLIKCDDYLCRASGLILTAGASLILAIIIAVGLIVLLCCVIPEKLDTAA